MEIKTMSCLTSRSGVSIKLMYAKAFHRFTDELTIAQTLSIDFKEQNK